MNKGRTYYEKVREECGDYTADTMLEADNRMYDRYIKVLALLRESRQGSKELLELSDIAKPGSKQAIANAIDDLIKKCRKDYVEVCYRRSYRG